MPEGHFKPLTKPAGRLKPESAFRRNGDVVGHATRTLYEANG